MSNNADNNLVALVQACPSLWDRECRDFKNKLKKQNDIKTVAAKMNTTEDFVIKRFRFLREKYRREKLRIQNSTNSDAGPLAYEPWYLLHALSFLDRVQLRRNTTGSVPLKEPSIKESQSEEELENDKVLKVELETDSGPSWGLCIEGIEQEESQTHCLQTSVPHSSGIHLSPTGSSISMESIKEKRTEKRTQKSETSRLLAKLIKVAENASEIAVGAPPLQSSDRFDIFGQHVAMQMRHVPPNKINKTMFAVGKVLYEAMESDDE